MPDAWLVGSYRYGGCIVDGERYAIIKNNGRIERIRRIATPENGLTHNPVVWQDGDLITDSVIAIMAMADFTPS